MENTKQKVVKPEEQKSDEMVTKADYDALAEKFKALNADYEKLAKAFNKLATDHNNLYLSSLFKD